MDDGRRGGRVLIVDDHPVAREGLSLAARAAMPGISVVAAGSAKEAAIAVQRSKWRMILLDLELPDAHGLSAILRLQSHALGTNIVVVSATEKTSLIEAARALGAAGYVFKSQPLDLLAAQLRAVDIGDLAFPPINEEPVISDFKVRIDTLSPSQRAVFFALVDGQSNKEIARELDVSEATIKAHLTAVFRKLGVTNRAQAMLTVQRLAHQ